MIIQNFYELNVWQKAMQLTGEVYRLTRMFPKEELYALTNQLRRAVVSIPSNIAEGQARESTSDFLRFLSCASGSLAEVETQIQISIMQNYVSQQETLVFWHLCFDLRRMLAGLKRSLRQKT